MREFTLYDLFVRNSRVFHNTTAIVAGDERITFAQLLNQSDFLAERLSSFGVGRGDRVAVLSLNHPGFFVLYGAVAKLGAILVPLNWRLSDDEIRQILNDCKPTLLYADNNQLEKARIITEPLHIHTAQLLIDYPETVPDTSITPAEDTHQSAACIIYTAAVEGIPRGAVLSHANLMSANLQVISSMGLTSNDAHLAMLPLFHITGMNLALAVIQLGGKNVVMEKFNEEEALTLTIQENCSIWGSFPPILGRMAAEIEKQQSVPQSLKYVVGLDGPESIETFEKLLSAKFWILYGQSETSGFVTFSQASDKLGTAGKQGPLSTFILVDDDDNEVPIGEIGEIVVRGPLVFQGYWNQDELNARTFRNGWHHTGDFGQLDEEGYLLYKGRKPEKELIKPGGENVYPAEVEAVIIQHPEIEAVSVIGVPDPKFGEGVKAICVRTPGSTLTVQELIEYVGSQIARYKKPSYVDFIQEMPMSGDKIDRNRVKELYGE